MPLPNASMYIQALREGDYLGFLQWGSALAASNTKVVAEDLINVVSYFWMLSGFKEEDLEQITIIKGVMEDEQCPVRGQLAYTATFLITAALQCKVYQDKKLTVTALNEIESDWFPLIDYMNQLNEGFDSKMYSELLDSQRVQMDLCLTQQANKQKVAEAIMHLASMLAPQNLLSSYLDRLEATLHSQFDKEMAIRLGVSQAFKEDLEKAGSNEALIVKFVKGHSKTLEELGMQSWEFEYLEGLNPRPLGLRLWGKFRDLANPLFQQSIENHRLERSELSEDEAVSGFKP